MVPADLALAAPPADFPSTYGRYRLLGRIGIGGMAEVFRGMVRGPEGWERELVVKRILPHLSDSAQFRGMFIREAKISALLMHPNIVQIYDFGEAEGTYFIAMESVQGVTLRAALGKLKRQQRAMPFMVTADIVRQICTGLDYAHALRSAAGAPLQIVHQDVSPTNVMLAYNGTAKILDFGIARAAAFAEEEAGKGLIKGKVAYLSPEQVALQPFDHRADIFAAGAVMHEMLTGLRLFPAKNDIGRMKQMLAQGIAPPSAVNAAVPRELDRIVMQALAIDPAERYQSAAIMAADLERTLIAARYSSRDLSKLLTNLFMPPEVPLVVVDAGGPPATGDLAPGPEPLVSTERMRPIPFERSSGSLDVALKAERTRLVWVVWRQRAKLALTAVALGLMVGLVVLAAKQYGPALLAGPEPEPAVPAAVEGPVAPPPPVVAKPSAKRPR